jgi:glycosyltransferase involved in cell wall biosynthesis
MSEARILHVLPHAGGGGETYVRQLEAMGRFRFERFTLTERRRPIELGPGLIRLVRAIPGHDLVHIHGDAAALACWPIVGRRPTVITLHGSHLLRRASGPRTALVRAGIRRALARAHTVIAVSESEFEYARGIAPQTAERIELIPNGVSEPESASEPERRAHRERLGLDESSVAALFAGELSERKQPVEFAEAVRIARQSGARLVGLIAGEGPLRPRLEQMQSEHLRLLGNRDDVHDLLVAADLFVLPSLWEGLPYVVLEAMALGRATLVSSGPGNPDAVGDAGLIFPVGDVQAMAEALSRLAGDQGLRDSLGEAAAKRAREHFSLSEMSRATAQVYERALRGEAAR